jgi:hypothetical protein
MVLVIFAEDGKQTCNKVNFVWSKEGRFPNGFPNERMMSCVSIIESKGYALDSIVLGTV